MIIEEVGHSHVEDWPFSVVMTTRDSITIRVDGSSLAPLGILVTLRWSEVRRLHAEYLTRCERTDRGEI